MEIAIAFAVLAVAAVLVATVRTVMSDGYSRVPTRPALYPAH